MRKPYQWGAQQYLANFNRGETREYDEKFPWRSLISIASKLKRTYGVVFSFDTIDSKRYITRIL